jgi:cytochrome bd-type quinol oxidase subunit 2
VTGIIATLLVVAVVATLMLIGIRTKLPLPDPDWREHLPKPPPPRIWWVLWLSRYPVLLAAVIAAAADAEEVAMALALVLVILTFAGIVVRLKIAIHARRQARPGHS